MNDIEVLLIICLIIDANVLTDRLCCGHFSHCHTSADESTPTARADHSRSPSHNHSSHRHYSQKIHHGLCEFASVCTPGMEAWFFTRISDDEHTRLQKEQGFEFVWRASSSLPEADTEIFCHVFESYYCMPLPTYVIVTPLCPPRDLHLEI